MLLPYINERINENTEVITILENDMSRSTRKVMKGIQGKKSDKLLKIDWTNKNLENVQDLEVENKLVLVSGSTEFMEKVNKIIENKKCTILNCFEMMQGSVELKHILDSHDKVVNTSGEKYPEEVFIGYQVPESRKISI